LAPSANALPASFAPSAKALAPSLTAYPALLNPDLTASTAAPPAYFRPSTTFAPLDY